MSNEYEYITYKFCLLGEKSVGKTSIMRRISKDEFEEKMISSIGIDVITLSFDDIEINENEVKSFKIQLIDTAGQEKYQSITKNYYRNSDAIILVYDINNEDSFELLENWIIQIKENFNDVNLVMLLDNKSDLERKVDERQRREFVKTYNLYWGGECSAKSFTQKKFQRIFKDFIMHVYSKIGQNQKKEQKLEDKSIKATKSSKCC